MTKLGSAINQTLKGIREVEQRKKEVEAFTMKQENDLTQELEKIMTRSTGQVLGMVGDCTNNLLTEQKPEMMDLHKMALAAQKGDLSQEGMKLSTQGTT